VKVHPVKGVAGGPVRVLAMPSGDRRVRKRTARKQAVRIELPKFTMIAQAVGIMMTFGDGEQMFGFWRRLRSQDLGIRAMITPRVLVVDR